MGGLGKPQPDPNPRRPENTTLPPAVYAARQIEDLNERRNAVTAASRDMRYFAERLRTAQRMPDPVERDTVAFGFRVRPRRRPTANIPDRWGGGSQSPSGIDLLVSPVARALIGKAIGDHILLGHHGIKVLAVE